MAARVVKNDRVVVIAGRDRGKEGTVSRVLASGSMIVVDGINTRIRHVKPRQAGDTGGRVEFQAPISVSNVAVKCGSCDRGVRIGYRFLEDGSKVRVCRKCGSEIEKKRSSDG